MRILFSYGVVGRGGDAVQILMIASALRNLGHEVELLGPQPLQPYDFGTVTGRLRTALRQLPWWFKDLLEIGLNLYTFQLIKRRLVHSQFDLVFHRAGIYDFIGAKIAKFCPFIAHLDAPFPMERAFHGEGYFKRLHVRAMRALGENACLIVTASDASKEYYVSLGLPLEKIIVMPNGISKNLYHLGLELAKEHPPLFQGPPWTIGFAGSLSRWHRVDLLLQAFERLGRDYRLLIVGYGEEYLRLQAQAKKRGIDNRIMWCGAMPHEQAVQEIAHFDIAVLPSTLSTGTPIKLFEYAAFARPIIAPDLPNLRAWFTDDEMCFVKPEDPQALANAILYLSRAPDKARQMGLRAQERAADYIWEKLIQRVLGAVQPGKTR